MQPHRVRPICCSPNPFSPSIALWQHFVLPYYALRQQRLFQSSVAGTAESSPNSDVEANLPPPPAPVPIGRSELGKIENHEALRIRRVVDRRAEHKYSSPRQAAISNNINALVAQSGSEAERLLLAAKMAFDEAEDYEGVIVQPVLAKWPAPEKALPWCVRPENRPKRGIDRLALEIAKFHEYAKPSRAEALARRHVIEQVRTHARHILPSHILEVFGSERTGIALATSDIDLRLMRQENTEGGDKAGLPPPKAERVSLLADLYALHWKQFSRHKAYILPRLRHARYPLIALQDRWSGLDIQIVLSNDTSISRNLMHKYMQEYPYLHQLYSVVKTIFDVRGLSDVFRGGFGSYSIFMMIVASLRHEPSERTDVAGALLNFLRFWRDFDTEKGISIEPVSLFDKSEETVMSDKTRQQILEGTQKPLPKYMLCLRDPADETNDLGRKGVCIKHVKATLGHLAWRLDQDVKRNTRHSLLAPLVGPVYSLNRERRFKLEQRGRTVLDQMQGSLAATAKAIRDAENDAQRNKEEEEKKALNTTPGDSESDDFGKAVTSILGMPSVAESRITESAPKEDVKIAYEPYPPASNTA